MVPWIEGHGWTRKGRVCGFVRDLVGKSDRHLLIDCRMMASDGRKGDVG